MIITSLNYVWRVHLRRDHLNRKSFLEVSGINFLLESTLKST